jgi:hypothetical protein
MMLFVSLPPMNLVYADKMNNLLEGEANPDGATIEERVKSLGAWRIDIAAGTDGRLLQQTGLETIRTSGKEVSGKVWRESAGK